MDEKPLNRHQRRRVRTRKQLQAALLALILEKGYENVSIQDITDRADLARATFYLHCKDKDELLWSVIEDVIHATERQILEDFTGVIPVHPEYFAFCNIFQHVEGNRDTYQVILGSKGSAEMFHRVHRYLVEETLSDIRSFNVYAGLSPSPEITAQIVVGSLLSLAIWWLETPNEYSSQDMAGVLYQTLFHRAPPSDT
ncbi:MAG: TetR/AcrR family transcriptional regulator [Anaerolineales bacterium]|jgi:AcrR family transcriptional regulator